MGGSQLWVPPVPLAVFLSFLPFAVSALLPLGGWWWWWLVVVVVWGRFGVLLLLPAAALAPAPPLLCCPPLFSCLLLVFSLPVLFLAVLPVPLLLPCSLSPCYPPCLSSFPLPVSSSSSLLVGRVFCPSLFLSFVVRCWLGVFSAPRCLPFVRSLLACLLCCSAMLWQEHLDVHGRGY